jgi:glycosyltransferase involved in cell wall biosynthesis
VSAAAVQPAWPAPTIVEGLYSFQIGGSEKLGALLARALAERGYRVLALSFFDVDGPIRAELEAAGIGCHGLGVEHRTRWQRLTLARDVRRWLAAQQVDVLHLHHGVTAIRGVDPARAAGVRRIVVTEHADLQLRSEPRYRARLRRTLPQADLVTGIDASLVDYFGAELGVPDARLALVPNAVDEVYGALRRDDAGRAALGLEQAFVFAFVGRLVGAKDLGTLLEALGRARAASGRDLRLVVAGDGPERDRLRAQAARLGVSGSVTWLGAQPDGRAALALADAFAMSSVSEGVPMALLEAMRAGLPCVATTVGGIEGVLRDGCGWSVPPADPEALARALVTVATDRDAAGAAGRRARARVLERYSLGSVVDRYLAAFELPPRWDGRVA